MKKSKWILSAVTLIALIYTGIAVYWVSGERLLQLNSDIGLILALTYRWMILVSILLLGLTIWVLGVFPTVMRWIKVLKSKRTIDESVSDTEDEPDQEEPVESAQEISEESLVESD